MSLKRALIFVETWGLAILVALTVAAFGMATIESLHAQGNGSLWQALMQTALSDAEQAQGWTGRMHLLFKATLGWAAVRVYMATAGLKWDHFSARWLARSHVVIVAGRDSSEQDAAPADVDKSSLALEMALAMAPAHSVVLALPALDEGQRSRLWQAGVRVVTGPAQATQLLAATGARRARLLVAMRDDPVQNIALTHAALSPATGNPALEVKCMIEPLPRRREFRVEEYFDAALLPRIRIFNEAELVARRLMKAFPPDAPVARSDSEGVHVLVVGLGSVGQSLLVQLARIGHYRSRRKPKVTVVDRHVGDRWREARQAHPALEQWLQVETLESRLEDVDRGQVHRWLTDERPVTLAYVRTKDEIVNLRVARLLLDGIKAQTRKDTALAAKVVALDPAGGCVLTDFAAHGGHAGRFHLFSLTRGAGGFMSDVDDERARQFHDGYCARDDEEVRRQPGRARAPANRPWEALDETLRNANRMNADHFDVKMRAIGCRIVPHSAEVIPATLSPQEVELLAIMEHDRWWADRALDGWTPGSPRDDRQKIHPNMVPYEALSEADKQKDRDNVNNMIEILRREGGIIVRDAAA